MSYRFYHTLGQTLESKSGGADGGGSLRRLELITGTGRRRQWSADEKARILLESLEPGANVSEVAQRHGMSPQSCAAGVSSAVPGQASRGRLWSKRERDAYEPACEAPAFAPVMLTSTSAPPLSSSAPLCSDTAGSSAAIEVAIGDCIVRIVGWVEATLLVAVLRAVRREA